MWCDFRFLVRMAVGLDREFQRIEIIVSLLYGKHRALLTLNDVGLGHSQGSVSSSLAL